MDAKAKAQLAEEGWCVLPDVLTPDETREALSRVWKVAEANEKAGYSNWLEGVDPNPQNVRVLNLIQGDPLFRELIQHPKALEGVRAVLGENFGISNFTANIARPGSGPMLMHSDQSAVAPEPWLEPWSVNIIWCLSDAHHANGATQFIPGSHRWRTRADIPADAPSRLRAFEAKAGSLVVMEGRIWHTSGSNITADEDRALLFGYYSAPFLRPQMNWSAALSLDLQASLSPEMRHWLGLNLMANMSFKARPPESRFAPALVDPGR